MEYELTRKEDLKEKYNRLTIIGEPYRCFINEKSKQKRTYIKVKCDCGKIYNTQLHDLVSGKQHSCGCYNSDRMRAEKTTHNLSRHPLYNVRRAMINRCYNLNDERYSDWGGRGISMCEEWRNDFMPFYNWAMVNGYKKGLTIDRKNNDGNYEPSNCRFTTQKEQNRNTRKNVLTLLRAKHIRILCASKKRNQSEVSRLYGLSQSAISQIITKKTWV